MEVIKQCEEFQQWQKQKSLFKQTENVFTLDMEGTCTSNHESRWKFLSNAGEIN